MQQLHIFPLSAKLHPFPYQIDSANGAQVPRLVCRQHGTSLCPSCPLGSSSRSSLMPCTSHSISRAEDTIHTWLTRKRVSAVCKSQSTSRAEGVSVSYNVAEVLAKGISRMLQGSYCLLYLVPVEASHIRGTRNRSCEMCSLNRKYSCKLYVQNIKMQTFSIPKSAKRQKFDHHETRTRNLPLITFRRRLLGISG